MSSTNKSLIVIFTLFYVQLFSQNLLVNGDFESGGTGNGFTVPGYTLYTSPTGDTFPGSYAVSNNPSPLNQFFTSPLIDHSPGPGNTMMVVDGHTNTNASFWSAGDTAAGLCGLTVGQTYTFSYWIRTISTTTVDARTQPRIRVDFTNATSTINFGDPTVGLPTEDWQQVIYSFVPTATCVNINLIDVNTSPGGNDFALDDMQVTEQLCPLVILAITNPNAVCNPNTVDITNPAITTGSIGNGVLSYWEDDMATISLANPSAISVSGTYYIRSTSGPTCTDIKPVLVSIKPVIKPDFDQVGDICEGSDLDPLPAVSKNGVAGSWSPALDNTTTTTYTFTPDSSPNPNLVTNGDFSLGNTGFVTDYINVPSSDGNGNAQGLYGIVANSNVWFPSLASCNDNTGGGNFMVADGSIRTGPNDRVWCQTITVQPNEDYIFSYFTQSVSSGSPAMFEVIINGVSIGNNALDFSTCNWVQNSFPWNSGGITSAEICIYDRNTTDVGNDFGIDDISFVPLSIQCAENATMTIAVNPASTPTFTPINPICSGDMLSPLPTTSIEGITGTWSPALDNTIVGSTTYTFTPTIGQCATTTPVELIVTVNPANVTPVFDPIMPICSGGTAPVLPLTSLNGIAGTWSPTTVDNTMSSDYIFTPNANQCATTETLSVVVNELTTPTFDPIPTICSGDTIPVLPLTSLNGITGTWSPTTVDNTMSADYTFTPNANQCASQETLSVVVNEPTTPTFNLIMPICSGETAPVLPLTSLNGITGTWSPATVNNTISADYIFTPNVNQCAVSETLSVVVNEPIIPTFDPIPAICLGDTAPVLPLTSLNGITGIWSPTTVDNTISADYTFTPNANQCATIPPVLRVEVNITPVTPTFDPIPAICSGDTAPVLPLISLNGITGTWSPAIVDNTMSADYIFTPNANQCATVETISVVVNVPTTPLFDPIAPICSGGTVSVLPLTSSNGIMGMWSPAVIDNLVSGDYVFTPNSGQCATILTLGIVVNEPITPIFDELEPICIGQIPPELLPISDDGVLGTWSPSIINNNTSADYTFTPEPGQCATSTVLSMTINQPTLDSFVVEVGEPFSGDRTVTVLAFAEGDYDYQLDNGIPQEDNVFFNVEPGVHQVTVNDVNGCSQSVTKELIIVDYPKFFTPNGDSFNDRWNVLGLDQPEAKIFIYDRYGKLLKQISAVSPGWDGTYNGNPLPSSDYWFTVDFLESNENKQFKAHFALKR
ncbi:T9SS type B sorting domain-containing protein [uncultured Algibacter sp.]|uniref:T9SS type B sorting domain-containing protein n=1 Tax=uncultured Algibacter sp. TaxID=298659 RepID=UPI0032179F95